MKKLILFTLFCFVFIVCKAFAVDVYTFKKDRVDQDLNGNRGYIVGTPPKQEDNRNKKRTLIGIDVEIPSILKTKDKEDKKIVQKKEVKEIKKEAIIIEEKSNVQDDFIEEDWIK